MPFTPFHLGLGSILKGAAPKQFSFTSFAASQVVIDLESLYHILRHEWPVHRVMHTLPVATAVGVGVGCLLYLVGRPLSRYLPKLIVVQSEVALWPLILGGVVGGVSHPILDGLMHSDVRPFLPMTAQNPLLGAVSMGSLHVGCMIGGVMGVALLAVRTSLWERTA